MIDPEPRSGDTEPNPQDRVPPLLNLIPRKIGAEWGPRLRGSARS